MKRLTILWVLILFLCGSDVYAEEIQLYFPNFTGYKYEWKIFQGEQEPTVRSGEILPDGRVTLTMPGTYQDYQGMTRWLLKKGGGLDMIYTGKGFSVECLSEKPSPDNIIYNGNPENDFLKSQHRRQQTILDKLGAVNHVLQVYAPAEDLHKTALAEQIHLRQAFEKVQADRAESPLYAARFGEIVDFTRGIADKIYENQDDHIAYFNDFVTHTLDFKDLYTSGHWDQVLHHWLMMNIRSGEDDAGVTNRLDIAMSRMEENNILAAFAEKTVPLLVEKGKDDHLPNIKATLGSRPDAKSQLSASVKNMLESFTLLTGTKGPDLVFHAPMRTRDGVVNQDIVLKTHQLDADFTVLLFYRGDCPLCEDALIDLANKYQKLRNQNVRVIAVSADENEQAFNKKLAYHQWPDNYCDFSGMNGENYKNYAVLGVPTLYLLDRRGIILKKSAMVDELIRSINEKKSR